MAEKIAVAVLFAVVDYIVFDILDRLYHPEYNNNV